MMTGLNLHIIEFLLIKLYLTRYIFNLGSLYYNKSMITLLQYKLSMSCIDLKVIKSSVFASLRYLIILRD